MTYKVELPFEHFRQWGYEQAAEDAYQFFVGEYLEGETDTVSRERSVEGRSPRRRRTGEEK